VPRRPIAAFLFVGLIALVAAIVFLEINGMVPVVGDDVAVQFVIAVADVEGYDAERLTGYAWGMGVERIAALRHGVPDIRWLWENDLRLMEQFR